MKIIKLSIAFIICIAVFASCKSKEEKAEELIRTELSKTLYDFDSYKPIETTVKVAKANAFNDSTCWNKASVLAYGLSQVVENVKEASNATEHMAIWGKPTYYSSSYSDNQYYKYKSERDEYIAKANLAIILCNSIANNLADTIAKLDTSQVVGWEVIHDFRCKTRGGNSEIGHYRYIVSKNFKEILLWEDTEQKSHKDTRDALETVVSGWEDLTPIDL